jgi:hypothetical protein
MSSLMNPRDTCPIPESGFRKNEAFMPIFIPLEIQKIYNPASEAKVSEKKHISNGIHIIILQ